MNTILKVNNNAFKFYLIILERIIIGNKDDLSEDMQTVKEAEVKKFAAELRAEFIKTSTMEGNGMNYLDKLFKIIWIDLLKDAQSNQENVEEEKSKCCECSKCCKCFH